MKVLVQKTLVFRLPHVGGLTSIPETTADPCTPFKVSRGIQVVHFNLEWLATGKINYPP